MHLWFGVLVVIVLPLLLWLHRRHPLSPLSWSLIFVFGLTLPFEDGEGQRFRLIDDGGIGSSQPWAKSPVPAEHQIRGLGPITISVPAAEPRQDCVATSTPQVLATRPPRSDTSVTA